MSENQTRRPSLGRWLPAIAAAITSIGAATGCGEPDEHRDASADASAGVDAGGAGFDCPGWCAMRYSDDLATLCEDECERTVPNLRPAYVAALSDCVGLPLCAYLECEFWTCYLGAFSACTGDVGVYVEALCREQSRCFGPDTEQDVQQCIADLEEASVGREIGCFTTAAVDAYAACTSQDCLPNDDASVNQLDDQCSDQSFGLHGFGDNDQCLFFIYVQ